MSVAAGIDIGSEAIKGIVLGSTKQGTVEVLAAGTMPISDLGQMPDSPDKMLAIGIKLKELVKSARLRGKVRRLGATARATAIRYIQVPPVPPWRLDMLVNYEVQERANDKEANTYDYHILDVPEVGGQYTVLIGMLKEAVAVELMATAKSSGLGEVELDLEALALYNAYYHGHGFDSDKTVLVADIGADDLTILLCKGGGLYFARTIMGAGRRFTQVLSEELKIDPQEAEELKKSGAEITFDMAPTTGRTGRIQRPGGATAILPRPGATAVLPRPSLSASAPDAPAASTGAADPALDTPAVMAPEDGSLPPSLDALDQDAAKVLSGAPAVINAASGDPTASATRPSAAMPEAAEDRRKRQMSGALVREAASLCAALENAVLFSKQQAKLRELKIDRLYITGGGSKLKGLAEFMNRRMRLEVLPLEPLKKLSLSRMPAEQAEALKAEQHTLAVAVGLAVADLQKGAFSFLLWPEALKQRKTFWSRGAYLYYAAALVVLALGLFLFTPFRNTQALAENFNRAETAVGEANVQTVELKKLNDANEEQQQQLKQIADNTLSGHYFLNLLAELKNTRRISNDVWLTSVSTNMPQVVRKLGGEGTSEPPRPAGGAATRADVRRAAAAENAEPDTFQTQRRVYLRGFVRGNEKGEERIIKIRDFYSRMLPHPDDPENPANLFKDVRPIWFSTDEIKREDYYLTEFVLEAYTEGTRTGKTEASKPADKNAATAKTPAAEKIPKTIETMPVKTVPADPAPAAPKAPAVSPVPAKVEPPAAPAPEPLKKKKFITPAAPPAPANAAQEKK